MSNWNDDNIFFKQDNFKVKMLAKPEKQTACFKPPKQQSCQALVSLFNTVAFGISASFKQLDQRGSVRSCVFMKRGFLGKNKNIYVYTLIYIYSMGVSHN